VLRGDGRGRRQRGEMAPIMYAHMNKLIIKKKNMDMKVKKKDLVFIMKDYLLLLFKNFIASQG
jgi:hypothetical protein